MSQLFSGKDNWYLTRRRQAKSLPPCDLVSGWVVMGVSICERICATRSSIHCRKPHATSRRSRPRI